MIVYRYSRELRAVIEHLGRTVETFIGDAVMAVFGIRCVQEDDAVRAVRAAVEIRQRLPAVRPSGPANQPNPPVVSHLNARLSQR